MQHMTVPHAPVPQVPDLADAPRPTRAFGVYIGRFEPPHQAHLLVMLEALRSVQTLIVVIGSARAARNTKNPFTAQERQDMIRAMLEEAGADIGSADIGSADTGSAETGRLRFVQVRDHLYDESRWLAEVRGGVQAHVGGSRDVALVGHIKDDSSYYLRSFPDWEFLPTHVVSPLSATDVRRAYFAGRLGDVRGMVPPAVHIFLERFRQTPEYAELRADSEALSEARAAWEAAPQPPTFLSADALVSCAGHVLLVRRADRPGRGLLALPGDLLGPKETLLGCAARVVRQLTGLGTDLDLSAALRAEATFDHPDRSQRGRVVSHAFHFVLDRETPPELAPGRGESGGGESGEGELGEARWLALSEVLAHPELLFEDHHEIIGRFLSGVTDQS